MQLMDIMLQWVVFFKQTRFTYIQDDSLFIEKLFIFLFNFPNIMDRLLLY